MCWDNSQRPRHLRPCRLCSPEEIPSAVGSQRQKAQVTESPASTPDLAGIQRRALSPSGGGAGG